MNRPAASGQRITRIVAANGITYGSAHLGTPWGWARCPLVPRVYRDVYGKLEAPSLLRGLGKGDYLTLGDLDSDVWGRLEVDELPGPVFQSIRNLVSHLPCPEVPDAIPSGLPLSWVAALPLRTRTRNAVLRLMGDVEGDELLEGPVSSMQLLSLPSVGSTTVVDLMCVMESTELGPAAVSRPQGAGGPGILNSALSLVESSIRDLATWALAETEFTTMGSVISHVTSEGIDTEVWPPLATLRLHDIAGAAEHPYFVLHEWASDLPDRDRRIFERRVAMPHNQRTLQQLADDLGVTRERIRQIEQRVEDQMDSFIDGAIGTPIRWRINTLRRCLGVAAPQIQMETLLATPDGLPDFGPLLLELAGPYDFSHGWVVLRSALETDPSESIRQTTDEFGRVDLATAADTLEAWGLGAFLHEAWLVRDGRIRSVNCRLVRWDGPIAEKLALALDELGKPATAEQLLAFLDEDRATTSAKNAMAEDDRFVRANRTEWALASWGLPEYSGIASAIRQVLEREDQPMRIDDVIERVREEFGIAEGSARAYCDAAMFVTEDGWIRLRREHEPYQYGVTSLRDSPGVFALGEGRVVLLYEVDRDVLRGSGRQLSLAAGELLGVAVNERLTFEGPNGTSVTVTFPGSSFMGPSLGSTRALAEEVGARLGDQLTVVLDRTGMSVGAKATDVMDHDEGWPLVARLTGSDAESGMDGLASALHCNRGEVRAVLRGRGDNVVIAALPARRSSPDLVQALAELAAEMHREDPP